MAALSSPVHAMTLPPVEITRSICYARAQPTKDQKTCTRLKPEKTCIRTQKVVQERPPTPQPASAAPSRRHSRNEKPYHPNKVWANWQKAKVKPNKGTDQDPSLPRSGLLRKPRSTPSRACPLSPGEIRRFPRRCSNLQTVRSKQSDENPPPAQSSKTAGEVSPEPLPRSTEEVRSRSTVSPEPLPRSTEEISSRNCTVSPEPLPRSTEEISSRCTVSPEPLPRSTEEISSRCTVSPERHEPTHITLHCTTFPALTQGSAISNQSVNPSFVITSVRLHASQADLTQVIINILQFQMFRVVFGRSKQLCGFKFNHARN